MICGKRAASVTLPHARLAYLKLRFLVVDDPALTRARLALVQGVATVIASGLAVIGVEPVEEMR